MILNRLLHLSLTGVKLNGRTVPRARHQANYTNTGAHQQICQMVCKPKDLLRCASIKRGG